MALDFVRAMQAAKAKRFLTCCSDGAARADALAQHKATQHPQEAAIDKALVVAGQVAPASSGQHGTTAQTPLAAAPSSSSAAATSIGAKAKTDSVACYFIWNADPKARRVLHRSPNGFHTQSSRAP